MTSNKNVQFLHPTPPPFLSVQIGRDLPTPGHRNVSYQRPPTPIPFGILAKGNAKKKTKMLSRA